MGIGDEEDDDEDDKAVWQVDEWWWLWWRRWGLQNYVTSWLLREAHRAEVDRAKEVEQQLAEAYRSLQNIIIMMESRSSRWCAYRSLQTIIIMMEKMIKKTLKSQGARWNGAEMSGERGGGG